MDEFIAEIKEDVRRDQLIEIWNKYGNYIIGIILIALLCTGVYLFWKHQIEKELYNEATVYEEALNLSKDGKTKEAKDKLNKLIATASVGYKTLASFELAKMKADDFKESLAIYQAMVNVAKIPEVYRQLASYKSMVIKVNNNQKVDFEAELRSLGNKSPWLPSAIELEAIAYLKAGQDQKARSVFAQLSQSKEIPSGLRLRAIALSEEVK
jgi:hypothetical protein